MPLAHNGEIDLYYETLGDPSGKPLLLIMGLGAQLVSWDDKLCAALVAKGFHVARYDNRDVGESTWLDDKPVDLEATIGKFMAGEPLDPPYRIEDMADDAAAVLDALGWSSAHVMGASMGGMIAQAVAIRHPDRVRSLISIMSTTGDSDVGQPTDEILGVLLTEPPPGREAAIEASIEVGRAIGSPTLFDEERDRHLAEVSYDRGFHPEGTLRQLVAVVTATSRTEALRSVTVPALVIHGLKDLLVQPSGGRRTAEALPNAELVELEEAGHDMPEVYRADLIDKIMALAVRADDAREAASV